MDITRDESRQELSADELIELSGGRAFEMWAANNFVFSLAGGLLSSAEAAALGLVFGAFMLFTD